MRLVWKLALYTDEKVFGQGPFELLSRVATTGSLRHAAADMDMSYSKAWHLVRTLEGRLGFPLLERRVGGSEGGGSGLTEDAKELVRRYEALLTEAGEVLPELFLKHFGDFGVRSEVAGGRTGAGGRATGDEESSGRE